MSAGGAGAADGRADTAHRGAPPSIHVPYRGAGPALVDLLGGQVQVMFASMSSSIGYVRAGKLRALAVTTLTRSPAGQDEFAAALDPSRQLIDLRLEPHDLVAMVAVVHGGRPEAGLMDFGTFTKPGSHVVDTGAHHPTSVAY